MEDTLLTPNQAAELLGVTRITLARWRKEGNNLPFIRMGGRIRYRRSHIEDWLSRHTEGAGA